MTYPQSVWISHPHRPHKQAVLEEHHHFRKALLTWKNGLKMWTTPQNCAKVFTEFFARITFWLGYPHKQTAFSTYPQSVWISYPHHPHKQAAITELSTLCGQLIHMTQIMGIS